MESLNELIEGQLKKQLTSLLKNISDNNLHRRSNNLTDFEAWKTPPRGEVSTLFMHNFFDSDTRDWDGKYSNNVEIKNYSLHYVSRDPYTIIGVPDEENIYLRLHPTEYTHKGDERVPSRDFLLGSYPWSNVFMINTLEENRDNWAKVIRESTKNELKGRSLGPPSTEVDVDVAYFGISKDASSSFREIISWSEFEKMTSDSSRLSTALEERGFSGFAYKIVKKQKSTIKSKLTNQSKPRNFIVFIDSLDLSILDCSSFVKGLTALPHITSNSIIYKNFTASGDWTYPCLFSVHTGTLPQFNFSNFRHDPKFRFVDPNRINHEIMPNYYISRSLYFPDTMLSSKEFLTRKIAQKGFSQAGIKSSRNHGWRCGLTHSLELSFENCSVSEIPEHLRRLTRCGIGGSIDTFFIDIDCLHRNDMFTRQKGQHWNVDHAEWIQETPDKYERLLGIYKDADIELRRYKDKLITVDKILTSILEEANPEDNILIFSDHGTQYMPWVNETPYAKQADSTLSPERIWKPTLLVYAPNNEHFNGHRVSEELVSTSDLYSIILSLHNIEVNEVRGQSILPKSLGGNNGREIATTFGLTVKANEKHPELSQANRFELVVRRGGNKGDIHACDALRGYGGKTLEELSHHMFPTVY